MKTTLVHDDPSIDSGQLLNLEGLFILSEAKIRDEVLYLGYGDKVFPL